MFLLYFLSNCLLIGMGTVYQFSQVCKVVTIRRPRLFVLLSAGIGEIFWILNSYVPGVNNSTLDVLNIIILTFSAPVFAVHGQKLKAFFASVIFMGIQVSTMYIVGLFAFPIGEKLGYSPMDLIDKTTSFGNAIMILICMVPICSLTYFTRVLLCRFFFRGRLSPWLLCFLPIPISQALMINLLNRVIPPAGGFGSVSLAFTVAIVLSIAADIAFFIGSSKIQQSQKLKDQIRMVEEQLEIQTGYYRQLQENILSINQIRHDLSNQLQAAYHLLEHGEHSQVRSQLNQLQESIQNRVGPKYCANPMVDAVLTEKARFCRDNGICLDVHANLPSELPIESAHLCSAFSNLLDNSIHAIAENGSPDKTITLETVLRSNCLIIRCSNPAGTPAAGSRSKDPLRSHGLGLDILRRIAKVYHGTFETEYRNARFTAVLILPYSDSPDHI